MVPCFNEADRLSESEFRAAVARDETLDFIFVDDGSTDQTRVKLQSLCENSSGRMRCLMFDKNGGKAEAVRQGFMSALDGGYRLIGYWDADLATPLDAIPHFIGCFDDPRVLLVLGSRVKLLGRRIERRPLRHYLGRVMATFVSITLRLDVYDTQCGAKLFRVNDALRDIFSRPFLTSWVFDVEILARYIVLEHDGILPSGALSNGIIEYPVQEWRDIPGSKIRPLDFLRAPIELLKVYFFLKKKHHRE